MFRARPTSGHFSLSDASAPPAGARRNTLLWLLSVGLVATLLSLPFMNVVYWMGDEGVMLDGAQRLLRGDRLYADFFEFMPPGGFLLTAAWFKIAGISFFAARSLAVLTIVGIACFTYLACEQASKNAPLSALLVIGWVLVMVQGWFMAVGHHWSTTLFSMVAAWAALASLEQPLRGVRWPLIAGIAAGAAAMIIETCGALVMLAAATAFLDIRRHPREFAAYVLAGLLVPAGLLAYLVVGHTFAAAFHDIILFSFERYAPVQPWSYALGTNLQNYPLEYLFPLAALVAILACARNWRAILQDGVLRVCCAFGLAGFAGTYPRGDMPHITYSAPLALPLIAYGATLLSRQWRPVYRFAIVGISIGLCTPVALSYLYRSWIALHSESTATPRGDIVYLGSPGAPELLARIAATPSEDTYFFYPHSVMLPFLTAREQVSKHDDFLGEFTLPSQYQDACIAVIQHASWVVIDRKWTDLQFLRAIFPGMKEELPKETQRFEAALNSDFELVAQEGTYEVRRRREGISDSICADITK